MYSYNLTVNKKKLEAEDNIILREGSMSVDELVFTFDESWGDYNERIAIFIAGKQTLKRTLIDNKCVIPREVYDYPKVELGILGKTIIDNEVTEILPSNPIMLFIRAAAEDSENIDVDYPSEWETYILQITTLVNEMREEHDEIMKELDLKVDKTYVDELVGSYEEEMRDLLEGAGI